MDRTAARNTTRQCVRISVADNAMAATMVLHEPEQDQPPITVEEVYKYLEQAGVVFGIDRELIENSVSERKFVTPLRVATGRTPTRGKNAVLEFHFETTRQLAPKEDEDGRIDYHEMSFIQNTHEGDVLVTKTPPTRGEAGMTVTGKELEGPLGRDFPIKFGQHTSLSEDGLTLTASASGAIVYSAGRVSVSDVTTIRGDVDFNVGNIDCAGSVRITGGVKTGFVVKCDGNIEIAKNVEDATIEATGNIYIKGGFFGDGEGSITAEGDVVVKYVEGQRVTAGGDITVGGEIINSTVESGGTIEVKGRRGKIVGGEVRARRDIRASVIGCPAGSRTVLYAGYVPDLINEYRETYKERARVRDDGERVKQALYNMYRLQMDGKLSSEKEKALARLEEFQGELPQILEGIENRMEELESRMREIRDTSIVAETMLYTGVRAYFGTVYKEILEDWKGGKLIFDGNQVVLTSQD